VAALAELWAGPLRDWKVLVTAGGTREAIDPVRYVGNHSSGKMGHAMAVEAAARGAEVHLVTAAGLPVPPGIEVVRVESAAEMEAAVEKLAEVDVAVLAAAVADFRPASPTSGKLSRSDGPPQMLLEPTPDILAGVVSRHPPPFVVGFAAETGSLDRAVSKARDKGVDVLVANDVTREGSGFG
ncbi:MAG: phosphopantothenoylcysteine decarboxylase, partial [Acidimicrobiia bacterium]